jgi:hypothetical protein
MIRDKKYDFGAFLLGIFIGQLLEESYERDDKATNCPPHLLSPPIQRRF